MKKIQRNRSDRFERSGGGILTVFFILTMVFSTLTAQAQVSNAVAASDAPAVCATAKHPLDYDGDGKTDPTVVRNTGGGSTGQITWFISNSGSSPTFNAVPWGIVSDFFISGDFDGDNKADIVVWRPGAQAYFYIIQSQTNTFRSEPFGVTGDDPTVVGDYTGDGKTDLAVYRSGANSGQPSFWYYRDSNNTSPNQFTAFQWGQNGDFPAPGDYDGDGKYDFVVQRSGGCCGAAATFYLSQTTAGFAAIQWGTATDVIVPGDYDGDCKTDITVVRASGGLLYWYSRKSTDGTLQSFTFGNSATDFFAHGDYDGDGTTDIGVWRPTLGFFYWRRSTDGMLGGLKWGQSGDYPVANFNRH